jgi:hypothetical protein
MSFIKHLLAEKAVQEFVAGKGTITRWIRVRTNNHWFDSMTMGSVAGHVCGFRVVEEPKPAVVKTVASGNVGRGDGGRGPVFRLDVDRFKNMGRR